MASLLSSVTEEPSRKRKSSPVEMPSSEPVEPSSDSSFFSGHRKRYGEEEDDWGGKKPRVSDLTVVPDIDMSSDVEVEVKPEPDDDDEIKIKGKPLANSTRVNANQRRVNNSSSVKHKTEVAKPEVAVKNEKPIVTSPPTAAHWSTIQETLAPKESELDEVKASTGTVKAENVLEEDGNLRIFFLDFMEQDGVIHLIGKVLDRKSGRYVSACLSISGIERNLYVKPRPKRFCESSPL